MEKIKIHVRRYAAIELLINYIYVQSGMMCSVSKGNKNYYHNFEDRAINEIVKANAVKHSHYNN